MAITIKKGSAAPAKRLKIKSLHPVGSITSLSSFITKIINHRADNNVVRVYRGHSKQEYLLKPSVFRKQSHRRDEKNILRELLSVHPGEFINELTVFEQLVKMQHYALETRLFDVSFNPLVALYFAVSSNRKDDAHFITFEVKKSKIKYFDSDAVSCIANLSKLTVSERNVLRKIDDQKELNESETGKRLLQFIRSEKPYFLPIMEPDDLSSIYLVKPKQNNRRILAQQGAFFIFGLTSEIDPKHDDIAVIKTHIPAKVKQIILKELDLININPGTLFPEVEYAAKYIMSKLTPSVDDDE